VVQDPDDAVVPSMPQNALRYVSVDYRVKLVEIAPLLVRLSTKPIEERGAYEVPEHLDLEIKIAKQDPAVEHDIRQLWEKSSYTCPECHGVLLQHKEGNHERFRCHTGHAFTADILLASVTEAVEDSLWSTVRTIEESVMLMTHMGKHLKEHDPSMAAEFLKKAQEADKRSKVVREAIAEHEDLNAERIEEGLKANS
jgi:two-component system, chemotaxis family, protein-glutamate methylesterase/glutaminase